MTAGATVRAGHFRLTPLAPPGGIRDGREAEERHP